MQDLKSKKILKPIFFEAVKINLPKLHGVKKTRQQASMCAMDLDEAFPDLPRSLEKYWCPDPEMPNFRKVENLMLHSLKNLIFPMKLPWISVVKCR